MSSILIGVATLLAYLVSQLSAKSREDRRRLRRLTRRDIAWSKWGHAVLVWAAQRGHDDVPDMPRVLVDVDEDE